MFKQKGTNAMATLVMRKEKKPILVTEGKLLPNIIRYVIPIIFTNILQLLYNSADMFVIGNFCEDPNALGSVGCTSSLINMILGLFIGMGAGVCVTLSHSLGSGNEVQASKTVHTAVLLAIILGAVVSIIGFVCAPIFLSWMGTRDEFMSGASLYVKIYFLGSIPNIMYNFCGGMLRSRGDTLRPLIYSSVGGVVNVILNLLFVIVFRMEVEGVAIATIASQTISAVLSLIHLSKLTDCCKFEVKKLRISKSISAKLIKIGIPAGIQGSLFSFSNVILQSAYNGLGSVFVNANTAAMNVDNYIYNTLNAFYHSALTFASQNFGARKFKRLKKVFWLNCICVTVVGLVLGIGAYIFAEPLVSIFLNENSTELDIPAIIGAAKQRLLFMGIPYFLCGLMETGSAMLRSIGYSSWSTIISFFGSCLTRVIWVLFVFPKFNTIEMLYIIYPASWIFTFAVSVFAYAYCYNKKIKQMNNFHHHQFD